MHSKSAIVPALGTMLIAIFFLVSRSACAAPPGDACSLLTQAEVSAALGISVGAGQHVIASSTAMCGWTKAGSSVPSAKRVTLTLETTTSFSNSKIPMQGITKTPLSGVGDDALYIDTRGVGAGLQVKKGGAAFSLRVYGFPVDQIKAKEKDLAQKIVGRM